MTEQVAEEKKDVDTQIKEVIAEQKVQEEAKKDIVLECRVSTSGRIAWSIPPDLVIASYMLKLLDTLIAEMISSKLVTAKPKDDIKNKIMKMGGIFGGRK